MSEKKNILDIFNVKNLLNTLINFIETKVEIYKIQFKEEAAKAISAFIILILFSIIGLLFILFISLSLSELINSIFDDKYVGPLIVAGLYLLFGFIIYLVLKKIQTAVLGYIFSENGEEQKEGDN